MLDGLTNRAVRPAAVTVALAVVAGCGGDPPPVAPADPPPRDRGVQLPPELRALERQAGQLLDGGPEAFEARVAALRGHPVVVNQWASWCGPCRYEFPFFQRLASRYSGRVAFLGVNSQDARGDAEDFRSHSRTTTTRTLPSRASFAAAGPGRPRPSTTPPASS